MCGIIGYTGRRGAAGVITEGLKKLEYRGYDSFGIGVMDLGIRVFKKKGRISAAGIDVSLFPGKTGIGHTRWATHGVPNDVNAHPHTDCTGNIAVVHNGIVENYAALKAELEAKGHVFKSDTDTEVIPHLLEELLKGREISEDSVFNAVSDAVSKLDGSFALLILVKGCESLFAARRSSPLVIGIGDGEVIASSDVTPVLEYTQNAVYLEDGDIAVLTPESQKYYNGGALVKRESVHVEWDVESARMGGYSHFMEKEIFEEPDAFYNSYSADLSGEVISALKKASSITVTACGSSYYAGLIFRYLAEKYCGIPVYAELASEFSYFPLKKDTAVIALTQSGETADTIAAVKHAKKNGCFTLAITNVLGSTVTRTADCTVYTRAGPEISVCATKSYISQTAVLLKIISELSNGALDDELYAIHPVIDDALLYDGSDAAELLAGAESIYYIGRGVFLPVVLEGALKIKEITYIHAEGYAAGELKHGPISLLSEKTPVVAVCTDNENYPVMFSNIREIKSRGAPLIVIGSRGNSEIEDVADIFIPLPESKRLSEIISAAVILQIIAYRTAVLLKRDVDKPRNLAKSVTVI